MQDPPNYPWLPKQTLKNLPQRPRRRIWQWYRARGRTTRIGLGCSALIILIVVLFFCSAATAGLIAAIHPPAAIQPTATATTTLGQGLVATITPLTALTPTDQPTAQPTPTQQPTPKPTPTPTPRPQPTPTPRPTPRPTPTPSCQQYCNPWGYNFNPGNLIYYPPGSFCSYFNCIGSFWNEDKQGDGYVVQCVDGTFSLSGGERGACSGHSGEGRPLYSH